MSEVERIEETIARIGREKPSLKAIADAFGEILVSRAVLEDRIPEYRGSPLPSPDLNQHREGQPLLAAEHLAGLMDPWGETAASTVAPLVAAFPGIAAEARRLQESLDRGDVDLGHLMEALMKQDEARLKPMASRLAVSPPVLKFILGQMLQPFVEKRTRPLRAPVSQLPWHRGYCPICGSFPEITFLQGEGGQRWLRCSLCGHEWQFNRMLCPHCEVQGQKKDLISIEGRRHEFAELYPDCRRYIVGIDLRERRGEPITPASAIGLVHLDILAQDKGYLPVAQCAWNMVKSSYEGSEGERVERR